MLYHRVTERSCSGLVQARWLPQANIPANRCVAVLYRTACCVEVDEVSQGPGTKPRRSGQSAVQVHSL